MKILISFSARLFLLTLLLGNFASFAQAQSNAGFNVYWPTTPAQSTGQFRTNQLILQADSEGVADLVLIAGSYSRSDRTGRSAFLYDHFGFVDPLQPQAFWDIEDLVGPLPPSWAAAEYRGASFTGINSAGRVCGVLISDVSGNQIPFFLDLFDPNRGLRVIPFPSNAIGSVQAWAVNEMGEIIVTYQTAVSGPWQSFVYVPETNTQINIPVMFASAVTSFNTLGQVVGERSDGMFIRYTITSSNGSGITEEFPNLDQKHDVRLNELGQFAAILKEPAGRNRVRLFVARYGGPTGFAQEEWRWDATTLWNSSTRTGQINLSGDILVRNASSDEFYVEKGDGPDQFLSIRNLVLNSSDPDRAFRDAWINAANMKMSDRDRTGFGWLTGEASPVGSTHSHLFVLMPEISSSNNPLVKNSTDTPLGIPDNNTNGVTSTIAVAENVTIANLTVTLNISHSRLSDLRATLIGPNNVSVTLPNLTGVNDVGNFDGGVSVGNWRVKVVDSVRKQTGTLNGWTLTIDH